ncbi:aldehyde reductase II [Fusarium phyllophilum]|uniref:Aldehyde reductase II n=1 Tax=Fusarium phyllophilum TaxID=47803 RepID=A0A8H5N8K8_9HYPO|nr:aldehyde reductase II [Fusarium phyllophilum]
MDGEILRSRFRLVEVSDILTPGAYDKALEGVDGVVHAAMNMDINPQNQGAIEDTINSNLYFLEAAAKVPSVKSLVITSSLATCALPTTWNTDAIEKTSKPWDGKGNSRWHGIVLYGAAKARSEQAAQPGRTTKVLMRRTAKYEGGRMCYNSELFGRQLVQFRLTWQEGNVITTP